MAHPCFRYRVNEASLEVEARKFDDIENVPKREGWKDTPAGMQEEVDALKALRAEEEAAAEQSKDDEIAALKAELEAMKASKLKKADGNG